MAALLCAILRRAAFRALMACGALALYGFGAAPTGWIPGAWFAG